MNYIEIVPRKMETFVEYMRQLMLKYPEISGANIPDIYRLDLRSYDVAGVLLDAGIKAIPHFRSIAQSIEDAISILEDLIPRGLDEILIIKGDNPESVKINTFPVSSITFLKKIKKRFPSLKVHCALDPYRNSFKKELEYCQMKLDAGADGFFTQALFDIDLARIYMEQLSGVKIYFGHSPVLTDSSKHYWETTNSAIFPANFKKDMKTNCNTAKQLIELADNNNHHTYLMPILAPVDEYLSGIFGG
ncbi:MAG: methylenetetrahydrofolate reductase [bacterium]|nr:methylenetetrahydrofolate reductase [bacterium]